MVGVVVLPESQTEHTPTIYTNAHGRHSVLTPTAGLATPAPITFKTSFPMWVQFLGGKPMALCHATDQLSCSPAPSW